MMNFVILIDNRGLSDFCQFPKLRLFWVFNGFAIIDKNLLCIGQEYHMAKRASQSLKRTIEILGRGAFDKGFRSLAKVSNLVFRRRSENHFHQSQFCLNASINRFALKSSTTHQVLYGFHWNVAEKSGYFL